jgi:voltage-gated potassium channel
MRHAREGAFMTDEPKTMTAEHQLDGAREKRNLDRERYRFATHIARASPACIVWFVLLVVDFTSGLSPALQTLSYTIWGVFILQFVLEFLIAPKKLKYLRRHWITAIALLVPAVRVLVVFRALRALAVFRGLRLVRVLGSANRGMRSLGSVMGRRGFKYASSLSLLVAVAGASGMLSFERGVPGSTIGSFASALWWTAMTLTTMGSDYFPKTAEGRVLCFLLALYGFAVFGYVTATIASYFVARDADKPQGEIAGARQLARLEQEIAALHAKLDQLVSQSASTQQGRGTQ